jgi:hypothetical protein
VESRLEGPPERRDPIQTACLPPLTAPGGPPEASAPFGVGCQLDLDARPAGLEAPSAWRSGTEPASVAGEEPAMTTTIDWYYHRKG